MRLTAAMARSFRLCRPAGCWRVVDFLKVDKAHLQLPGDCVIASRDVVSKFGNCRKLWLGAVTIGAVLPEQVQRDFAEHSDFDAVVGDAVGSETADAAMSFLHRSARQSMLRRGGLVTERRFSPGYGDWTLKGQEIFFALLPMTAMNVKLTPSFTMLPEKSVTAVAGIC